MALAAKKHRLARRRRRARHLADLNRSGSAQEAIVFRGSYWNADCIANDSLGCQRKRFGFCFTLLSYARSDRLKSIARNQIARNLVPEIAISSLVRPRLRTGGATGNTVGQLSNERAAAITQSCSALVGSQFIRQLASHKTARAGIARLRSSRKFGRTRT